MVEATNPDEDAISILASDAQALNISKSPLAIIYGDKLAALMRERYLAGFCQGNALCYQRDVLNSCPSLTKISFFEEFPSFP